jgi:flagellar protein FlbD
VILLTQLNGDKVYVNANLIETVEGKPDTVISLTNGKKLIVRESPDDVVKRFTEFARSISGSPLVAREEVSWI